ncbi:MAG: CcoQ/FixQ family Cbb3-type cytochrome c oxidase assembly chaperone [Wenzhouxiangella sp.]|nr:MAG: CcoQ/FixQ family Cbb3-type cytochrome c oxidase assembly chaperone [Wenzhouxiangella sp.]
MTAGVVTLFAMLAFVAIAVWVFVIKDKEDFDEQANLPLDEEDKHQGNKEKSS